MSDQIYKNRCTLILDEAYPVNGVIYLLDILLHTVLVQQRINPCFIHSFNG